MKRYSIFDSVVRLLLKAPPGCSVLHVHFSPGSGIFARRPTSRFKHTCGGLHPRYYQAAALI